MASLNKVMLIGNLGKDPEIRTTPSGVKKVSFSIATTESFKDKTTGEKKDKTEWHNIVGWRITADLIERLGIKKGTSLYIEGKLTSRSWDDPSGQKKYITEVEMDNFQILTPRGQGDRPSGGYQQNSSAPSQQSAPSYESSDSAAGDDLPF
jgi:single-strand DNA-binding protein